MAKKSGGISLTSLVFVGFIIYNCFFDNEDKNELKDLTPEVTISIDERVNEVAKVLTKKTQELSNIVSEKAPVIAEKVNKILETKKSELKEKEKPPEDPPEPEAEEEVEEPKPKDKGMTKL